MSNINIILVILLTFFFLLSLFLLIVFRKYIYFLKYLVSVLNDFIVNKVLYKPIPLSDSKLMKSLISNINRITLELQSYRAFQLNQVLDTRNKLEILIDTIPDGILMLNEKYNLLHCNHQVIKIMDINTLDKSHNFLENIRNNDWKGKIEEILSSDKEEIEIDIEKSHINNLQDLTKSGRTLINSYYGSIKKTFKVIKKNFEISSIKQKGVLLIIKDITLEKEIEHLKEDFFHTATHDLRTPLTIINGYTQMIYNLVGKDNNVIGSYFKTIFLSIKKQEGIITDILNYSKLKNNKFNLKLEKFNFKKMISQIMETYSIVAKRKKIELQNIFSLSCDEITADISLLERILANLLDNALKFTPHDGKITLKVIEKENEILFCVEDTGIGIPEDKINSIFEKYEQVSKTKLGFGIGLFMCKMGVELHKGKIWVESKIGKGSKFYFTISKNLVSELNKKGD